MSNALYYGRQLIILSSSHPESTKSMLKGFDEMDTDNTNQIPMDGDADPMVFSDGPMSISSDGTISIGDDTAEEFHPLIRAVKDDKIPAGKPDWTSAIEVHTTITVQEPGKAPTAVDHDMNLPEEPAEMEASANIQPNLVESFDGKEVELEPFNLLGCSDVVLEKILLTIFEDEEKIKPFWNFEALEVPAGVACNENIFGPILVAFAGNKRLMEQATTILYSGKIFELRDAKISLWWLRRIGSNISKLRSLKISVGEGVVDSFGTRSELLWLEIILLLKAQSNLINLDVDFADWTGEIDRDDGLDPATSVYIREPRYDFVRTLSTFRNIQSTNIKPGTYVPKPTTTTLRRALVMAPGETNRRITQLERETEPPRRTKKLMRCQCCLHKHTPGCSCPGPRCGELQSIR